MIIFDESGDYYAENPEIFSVVQGGIYFPEKNEPLKRGSVFFLSQNKYRFGIDDRCILIRISIDPQFLFFSFPCFLIFPLFTALWKIRKRFLKTLLNMQT